MNGSPVQPVASAAPAHDRFGATTSLRGLRTVLAMVAAALLVLVALPAVALGAETRIESSTFDGADGDSGAFTKVARMAIHQASGTIYVINGEPARVDKFDASGTAQDFSALGSSSLDVNAIPAPDTPTNLFLDADADLAVDNSGTASDGNLIVVAEQQQTVWVFNAAGEYLHKITGFGDPCGGAVDSSGHVWISDYTTSSVTEFDASGVATGNSIDTSAQGQPCHIAFDGSDNLYVGRYNSAVHKYDSAGNHLGMFHAGNAQAVAIDPVSGNVHIVEIDGVTEYDSSGTLVAKYGQPATTARGVAVMGSTGARYMSDQGDSRVHVFGPLVTLPDVVTNVPSPAAVGKTDATLDGTVDPLGTTTTDCHFEYVDDAEFQSNGYASAATVDCASDPGSGTGPVAVDAEITGLTPATTYHFRLVASNADGTATGSSETLHTDSAVTDLVTGQATDIGIASATLNGSLNPDGVAVTDCHFEYVDDAGFQSNGYANATTVDCSPDPGSGSGSVDVAATVSGLSSATTYHFRLVASNADGTTVGADQTFLTTGAGISGDGTSSVDFESATLTARINPNSQDTTYHFEYGTDTSYGQTTPESESIGSDTADHLVSVVLTGLTEGTTYHWRVVATNTAGTAAGPDRVFTTHSRPSGAASCANQRFRTGPSANLPDCRAYEMVSPVDKNNGDIKGICDALCYRAQRQQSSTDGNKLTYSSYKAFGDALSAPYSSQYIASRGQDGWSTHSINPPRDTTVYGDGIRQAFDLANQFFAFTPDLSTAWLTNNNATPLSPDGVSGIPNLYERDNRDDSYRALTTEDFSGDIPAALQSLGESGGLLFQGHSDNGEHAVFSARAQLTPDAPATAGPRIYDFTNEGVKLVSVLPNGTPHTGGASVGVNTPVLFDEHRMTTLDNAVSADGSRIFWTGYASVGFPSKGPLYVRIDGERTVEVSPDDVYFRTASADGSKVIFDTINRPDDPGNGIGSIYEFDVDSETERLVADNARGVLGASDDLSYIYFISTDQLAAGAAAGEDNLYLEQNGEVRFIARLSRLDSSSTNQQSVASRRPLRRAARVTPDGRHIAFQSVRSLTGYDNADAVTGEPDLEVFTYDADADRLACASCNPSGARPVGQRLLLPYTADGSIAWEPTGNGGAAAWLTTAESSLYAPRALLDDGSRLFFNSFDALVPGDTNGKQDVYQWTAPGSGGCERADGCVSLISSGTSASPSEFVDASADGRDVFFETASSLVSGDPGLIDIYDARIGGGFPAATPPPPGCVGGACRGASPTPEDRTPASSNGGSGNDSSNGKAAQARLRIVGKAVDGAAFSLRVKVAGKGVITAKGAGVKGVRRRVGKAGTYRLSFKLTAAARRDLAGRRSPKVRVRVRFAPQGGRASQRMVVLRPELSTKAQKTRAAKNNSGGAK